MSSTPGIWRWDEAIEPLREVLARGGMLAIPTESTYGLAVDPMSDAGVHRLCRFKGERRGKPLPVVAADLEQIRDLGGVLDDPGLRQLATAWPAPLTLVVPTVAPLPAGGGRATLGVRVPAHPGLRRLLQRLGHALTATSANRSGERPVLDIAQLLDLLAGEDTMIVDGGNLAGGLPSTVVARFGDGFRILRQGAFTLSRIRLLAGAEVEPVAAGAVE